MADIQRAHTPDNPLMQPVQYQGQEYFTSQYFHLQYVANSQAGGRYRRHPDFLRLLRGMDTYADYLPLGNIIELSWDSIKAEGKQDSLSFRPLFQAAGWNPVTLLDATAQAALSHHLDDEISKQMSVTINTTIARQVSRRTADLLPDEMATRKLSARLDAGKLLGVPLHIAQQEAVKAVHADTGIDYRPLLKAAPAQDMILPEQRMLEPTDLARELGWGNNHGAKMNAAIAWLGWQVKKIGGGWEATPAGMPHCVENHAWTSDHSTKSGYNIKWQVEAVRQALEKKEATP